MSEGVGRQEFKLPQVPNFNAGKAKAQRPVEHIKFDRQWACKRGSGGLAPSKSTLYIGNLPFSLTNNDLHKILEKFGRCIKVSIPRDKEHRSKGIAFALFVEREPCIRIINAFHGKQLFGRTLVCCIAKDNGRTREFIRRKEYPDKSQCYECGEFGHLSYKCTKNVLGDRRRPRKKKKKRITDEKKEELEVDDYFNPDISLAEAIAEDAASASASQFYKSASLSASLFLPAVSTETGQHLYMQPMKTEGSSEDDTKKKKKSNKRYQQDSYFSDEEILEVTGD